MNACAPGHAGGWRPDIDGLRGLAILAVVGYHFSPGWLQGGFVGVDIFFVISGYLITGILLGTLESGSFSIRTFYARRVRRIFPALAVVLATVLVLGWIWLENDEYARLGAHVAGGAGFVSNLLLWRESGYFDVAIETKLLAHLWSLGVEEQFYIVWPVLLWLVWGRHDLLRTCAVALVASLLAGVAMLQQDAPTAFYLPVFRFWELLAGAMLAVAARQGLLAWPPAHARLASAAGFLCIVAGFVLIFSGRAFPGWWALLPVLGACLVIAAGPAAPLNRAFLGNPVMVWLGLVSYPLYLWHWPLLALARLVFNAEPRAAGLLLLLGLALLLAWLTYRFVETPARAPNRMGAKVAGLAGIMAGVGLAGAVLASAPGWPGGRPPAHSRLALNPDPALLLAENEVLVSDCRLADPQGLALLPYCLRDGRGSARFALVGDSKAAAIYNGLVRTSSSAGRWLFVGGASQHTQIVPVLSDAPGYGRLQPGARLALATLGGNPEIETVVIVTSTRALFGLRSDEHLEELPASGRYPQALDGLRRFTAELLRAGKNVVLVVDNPTLADPRKCLTRARLVPPEPVAGWFGMTAANPGCRLSIERHNQLAAQYHRLLREVQRLAPERIAVFDTLPFLCDQHAGVCTAREGEHALYSYSDHISDYAGRKIGAALNGLLGPPGDRRPARAWSAPPPARAADSRG